MKIVVDMDLCQGHGTCVVEAPEAFELDEQGDLVVIDETPPEALRAKIESAVRNCPSYALSLEE